ncbi:MAG: hypothetical protein Q9185_002933 [Variospora sp. 1 TL-2023]
MERGTLAWVTRRADDRPLVISNQCKETIYPGIGTQAGTGPATQGFQLTAGQSRSLTVSADWQGRVWGRTNCSFNAAGTGPASSGTGVACGTGDCGGTVSCRGTGVIPVTLAEFTLSSSSGQTFYDISLVDGYNIPMGIIAINSDVPPNLTNPMCIGTASLLDAARSGLGREFGSNSSYPLPLEESESWNDVQGWCPWDLQLDPPKKPGDGVYPYPDDNIKRPYFNPCYSACAKYNKADKGWSTLYGPADAVYGTGTGSIVFAGGHDGHDDRWGYCNGVVGVAGWLAVQKDKPPSHPPAQSLSRDSSEEQAGAGRPGPEIQKYD